MADRTSITQLKGIGDKTAKLFAKLGIYTVEDLLVYYPRDYETFKETMAVADVPTGCVNAVFATVCGNPTVKKVRNLTAGEMVEQILKVEEDINTRITHVVIMGIGEPFDNFDNFKRFVEIVNYQKGINIGSRHITVSTCGIIPKIREFSEFPYQVNLAISLHAPNNEIRDMLMPINKAYPLDKLMTEIRHYIKTTNRRVTFEYILLSGINDSEDCANELCDLVRGLNCYINLIPYNETNNLGYKRSKKDTISKFYDIIKKRKINVTIRREFGSNISAACGQLRSKKEDL